MPLKKSYDPFRISDLLLKKLNDTLTYPEEIELDEWLSLNNENRNLLRRLSDGETRLSDVYKLTAFDSDSAFKKVSSQIFEERYNKEITLKRHRFYLPKIAAAAAILIMISIALWFYKSGSGTVKQQSAMARQEILPGSNKAILVLSNGTKINLQAAKNGTIANQAGAVIHKTAAGVLAYQSSELKAAEGNSISQYNTLYVPRGGQYQITLPDGSKVWLNAASSLKYPVIFNRTERVVELSGEAYFEIIHNAQKPFKVVTNGQTVEVLGTHFNVKSYPDEEDEITTLVQGSVKVTKGPLSSIIKPGEKVVNPHNAKGLITAPADLEEALAWKNGDFVFNDEPIQSIMKKLCRWYDVDVIYSSKISNQNFWGTYTRSKSLNSLLKNLEQTHTIHFKIEERRIIVMP